MPSGSITARQCTTTESLFVGEPNRWLRGRRSVLQRYLESMLIYLPRNTCLGQEQQRGIQCFDAVLRSMRTYQTKNSLTRTSGTGLTRPKTSLIFFHGDGRRLSSNLLMPHHPYLELRAGSAIDEITRGKHIEVLFEQVLKPDKIESGI